jgi:thymidine kinase
MHEGCPDGSIEVICGSMFSGKSEELIRRIKRASIARQKVQVFKHSLDNRFHDMEIASHSGFKYIAHAVNNVTVIEQILDEDTKVIGIDEAQFFGEELIELCEKLAKDGKRVIVAGLDQDFLGRPFGPMPVILSIAESVDKLHAICLKCGRPASRSQRLINGKPAPADSPIIVVGAAESYEARCRQCHEVPYKLSFTQLELDLVKTETGAYAG